MNRRFFLFAEYETNDLPLEFIADKYFGHSAQKAKSMARNGEYPFKVFRGGNNKSKWLVSIQELADYLDRCERDQKGVLPPEMRKNHGNTTPTAG